MGRAEGEAHRFESYELAMRRGRNSGRERYHVFSVVDRDGNMISMIQSNYESFGSGIVAPGTGFALHDRGGLFSMDSIVGRNALAGRKRPLHTIIPLLRRKATRGWRLGSWAGGTSRRRTRSSSRISQTQDEHSGGRWSASIQQAIVWRVRRHDGKTVSSQKVRDELTGKGHKIDLKGAFTKFGWRGTSRDEGFLPRG